MPWLKILGLIVFMLVCFLTYRFYLLGVQSQRGPTVARGVLEGHLAECGSRPNCVSTRSSEPSFRVEPLSFSSSKEEAARKIKEIFVRMGISVVVDRGDYLHGEHRSRLFGFVDDIEIYFPPGKSEVEMRSISRVGHSDLGVNRKRLEKIRSLFESLEKSKGAF